MAVNLSSLFAENHFQGRVCFNEPKITHLGVFPSKLGHGTFYGVPFSIFNNIKIHKNARDTSLTRGYPCIRAVCGLLKHAVYQKSTLQSTHFKLTAIWGGEGA